MAKYEQYTYKKGVRPAGEPSANTNFRDASPRPQTVGPSRNIHRVADTALNVIILTTTIVVVVTICRALFVGGQLGL